MEIRPLYAKCSTPSSQAAVSSAANQRSNSSSSSCSDSVFVASREYCSLTRNVDGTYCCSVIVSLPCVRCMRGRGVLARLFRGARRFRLLDYCRLPDHRQRLRWLHGKYGHSFLSPQKITWAGRCVHLNASDMVVALMNEPVEVISRVPVGSASTCAMSSTRLASHRACSAVLAWSRNSCWIV